MKYRAFRVLATSQYTNALMTVEGEDFAVPEDSQRQDIAAALGMAPEALETVEAPTDPRLGDLLPLPAPVAAQSRTARIAELQAIPRSNWTTAQMRELIDLLAQELTS